MKKQYMIGLDLSKEEQDYLKTFVACSGERSVRDFVKRAIFSEIKMALNHTSPERREAILELLHT